MFAVTSRSRGLALRMDGGEVASTKEQRCECLSRFFLMSYSGATPGVTQTTRKKQTPPWSVQRHCEADETVISSEGCSLSPAAGWTGNYTVRSKQAGSAHGSENREGETRRQLSLVKQKIFGALRCSEKSLLCVTEICFSFSYRT